MGKSYRVADTVIVAVERAIDGDFNINLITLQRSWLRPRAFFALEDRVLRDELLQLLPDGAYLAFAADAYGESRDESMDDHGRVLHALPGAGSSGRPALGDVLISLQERFNTLSKTANGNVRIRRPANLRRQ
jgi:hypothetical protein